MTVGEYLKAQRSKASLSQGKLASLAGVSQSTISDIENDSREVSVNHFVSICRGLKLSPSQALNDIIEEGHDNSSTIPLRADLRLFSKLTNQELSLLRDIASMMPSMQPSPVPPFVQVNGIAAAGSPLLNLDYSEDETIVINPKYLDSSRFFVIRVKGDSMEPLIQDGSHVVVQRNLTPNRGDIALVRLSASNGSEEYTIKKYYQSRDIVKLISINESHEDIVLKLHDLMSAEKVVDIITPSQ